MVYITSELFGSNSTHNRSTSPTCTRTHGWSDMADTQLGLGKRKRRIDDDHGTSPSKCSTRTSPSGRHILRLHGHDPALESNTHLMYPVFVASSPRITSDRRPVKQMKRSNPKLEKQQSHLMDTEPDPAPYASTKTHHDPNPSSDLRPCHACSAAPKRKRDLDNYMQCSRCDGRTCLICARECLGCKKAICKKCIVEVGPEGDSCCLECFDRHINS